MGLIYRRPWTRQPRSPRVNWASPITRGLQGLWTLTGNGAIVDVVGATNASLVGNPAIQPSPAGHSVAFDGSNDYVSTANPGLETGFSVGCFANVTDLVAERCLMAKRGNGGIAQGWVLSCSTIAGTVRYYNGTSWQDSGVAVPTGVWTLYGVSDRGAGQSTIYVGKQVTDGLDGNTLSPANDLTFGVWDLDSTPAGYFLGNQALWFAYSRPLSTPEWQSLAANPWQLFAPLPRTLWAPATVAGVPVLSLPTVTSITSTGATPRVTITF